MMVRMKIKMRMMMLMLMSVLVMIMIVRTAVMHDCYDAAIRPDVKLKHLVLMVLGGGVVATPKKANVTVQ